METVNAMASAAAKAVWGDSNAASEPVSGKTGNTAAGEPYDAGNLDKTNTATTTNTTNTTNTAHTAANTASSANAANTTSTTSSTNTPTTGSTGANTTGTHSGSEHPTSDTAFANTTGTHSDSQHPTGDAAFAKNTGTATTASDTPENPSTEQKLKDTKSSAGQQDTRAPEDPNTNPKDAPTEVNTQDHQEDGANEDIKLDGPGPRPLNEVAREHGGDAGKVNERRGSLVPPRDPNDTSTPPKDDSNKDDDKGDGTKYVKSSGLKADGGDFDAVNPGAGREADRLKEQKGIAVGPKDQGKSDDTTEPTKISSNDDSETKEKKKLSQRIKDKLHSH